MLVESSEFTYRSNLNRN